MTYEEFVEFCNKSTNDEIWDYLEINFEFRDKMLEDYAVPTSPEPTRSAIEALGIKFNSERMKQF